MKQQKTPDVSDTLEQQKKIPYIFFSYSKSVIWGDKKTSTFLLFIQNQLFSYSNIQVFIFRNCSCFRLLSLFSSFLHIQIILCQFFVFLCEIIPPLPPYHVKPNKNRCPLHKPGASLSPSLLASPHHTWFSFPI